MKNPYIRAIERRMSNLTAKQTTRRIDPASGRTDITFEGAWIGSIHELELLSGILKEFNKIDKQFSLPVVSKLRKIADQCEAGGHKSRARMFRALAKEFEVKYK